MRCGFMMRTSPFWQAARPSASATWVLPVPLLPSVITFSRRRTYSQRASSSTSILPKLGMAAKSNVSKLFTAGNRAARKDHIISMIDGKQYKVLRRHLSGHGLTPRRQSRAIWPQV